MYSEILRPATFGELYECISLVDTVFLCWNLNFEAGAVLHPRMGFPRPVLVSLALTTHAAWKDWRIRFIPDKMLQIKRLGDVKSFTLYDLRPFFTSRDSDTSGTLAAVAARFLDIGKIEIEASWYPKMDVFFDKFPSEAWAYLRRDAELVLKLGKKIRSELATAGVVVNWISPAASSAAALKKAYKSYPARSDTDNEYDHQSFYGGRFEVSKIGKLDRCYDYDIRSAYPYEMRRLVTLRDAHKRRIKEGGDIYAYSDPNVYGVYRVYMRIPPADIFGPLARRTASGGVEYPVGNFSTWCGADGLRLLRRRGFEHTVLEGVEYMTKYIDIYPFSEVLDRMYELRNVPNLKHVSKLVSNSAYGKLAQQTERWEEVSAAYATRTALSRSLRKTAQYGEFTHFLYAAAITERVRIRVYEVAMCRPEDVVSISTDGFLIEGEALDEISPSDEWGAWTVDKYDNGVTLGIGRYALYTVYNPPKIRMRGLPPNVAVEVMEGLKICDKTTYCVNTLKRKTLRESLCDKTGGAYNVLEDHETVLDAMPTTRIWNEKPKNFKELWERKFDSKAIQKSATIDAARKG